MQIPLLLDIVVIFAMAIVVILIFQRFKIPSIIGFLLTGIIAGPHGFAFVSNSHHEIDTLAEIGIILLLFTIGIEFSLKSILKARRSMLIGGSLQVGLTIAFAAFILRFFSLDYRQGAFIGFIIALSSTAIVLKILQEKAQINSLHGRTAMAILIFQDLVIVPMILVVPILAGKQMNIAEEVLLLVAKTTGLIIVTYFGSKWLIPKLLHTVAQTRSYELFMLTVLLIGFGVALFTSALGLSLALGAFLAGLAISESDYSHHAFGNIMPFRDIFTSFFFVSIGMLLDLNFCVQHPFLILLVTLTVVLFKTIILGFVAFILGLPLRVTVVIGLILSQVGEFSFILSKLGVENGLLSPFHYQLFLAVTIISMAASPGIIMTASRLSDIVLRLPLPKILVNGLRRIPDISTEQYKNHLIIVGMGLNGSNLAHTAKATGIPYLLIETNPDAVVREQAKGEPIFFGDASKEAVLKHAQVERAAILVIVVSDATATFSITALARRLNPQIYIIARTRFVSDTVELYKTGANEVIPEEFETSIEIFSRVLAKYLVPRDEIEQLIAKVRAGGYEMFRSVSPELNSSLSDIQRYIPDINISSVRIENQSQVVGKTIAEIKLRSNYGITIVAIKRNNEINTNPDANEGFYANDILYFLGKPEAVACATQLFRSNDLPQCDQSNF